MAKKSIDKTICFPGEDGWELWKQTEDRFGQAEYGSPGGERAR
ncbi:MAG: hypothetical protein ACJ0K4_10270 [Verrucomicrobiales bacterium]